MAILGVLLGLTISGLVALFLITKKHNEDHHAIAIHTLDQVKELRLRIEAVEKRKAAVAGAPEAVDAAKQPRKATRMRAWNEDIGAAGEAQ